MQRQSLDGTWEFAQADGDKWRPGTVPGDVYTDLLAAGEIPDPYVDDNELDVQWVGKTDWTYRRTVEVDESVLEHDRAVLRFDGVDTVAEVRVNGETVGETDNMHRRYEFAVGDALTAGENEVTVAFRSPVEYGVERYEAHPHEVPWMDYPVEQPARNFVRKAQYHYGWDWGPCLPTVGLWQSVELVAHSGPRVSAVATSQVHDGETVHLDVRAVVDAPSAGTHEATVTVADAEHAETIDLAAGENVCELSVTVEDPDLWWPHTLGEQPLYDLTVRVGEDAATERVGFRETEIVREPDERGESFAIAVNGVEIFAKGANWIPTHVLPGSQDPDDYDDLLGSARAANMNVVRVWGGGQYERERFYERCDELGLLVWQDFMFACSAYPADEAFLDTVEAEARHQVRRLSTHPSVAVWCGNNEIEMGLNTWFADAEDLDEMLVDYRRLFHDLLPSVIEDEHPASPYWPSSPSSGMAAAFDEDGRPTGEALSHDTGTMHDWRVWHEEAPFEAYEDVVSRFDAEFGYQSFASVDTLSEVVPEDQLNPTAPLMEHHQRSPGGNGRILARMVDNFRIPFDFESFVLLSQIQQVLAIQTGVEHWRRQRPESMGTIFWQLDDVWPCASWSSIEDGGRWKPLQYAARRFFAPVLVSTRDTDDGLEVWVTNDRRDPVSGELRAEAATFDGETTYAEERSVAVDAETSEHLTTIEESALLGEADADEVLARVSLDADAETYPSYALFDRFKRLALPDPGLSVDVDGDEVRVAAERAALYVTLSADADGHFSDNCVHLSAGEQRTLTFEGAAAGDELADGLSVTHLRDTY
ncbi:MAG: glycoside hydrolase family 2 protein [Haloarculaceae archaeon]